MSARIITNPDAKAAIISIQNYFNSNINVVLVINLMLTMHAISIKYNDCYKYLTIVSKDKD